MTIKLIDNIKKKQKTNNKKFRVEFAHRILKYDLNKIG